jgi:CBS domain-containing protein
MVTDFVTAKPDDNLEDLASQMHDRDVTHVPVVDGGKLVGIVARGDLVRFLSRTT